MLLSHVASNVQMLQKGCMAVSCFHTSRHESGLMLHLCRSDLTVAVSPRWNARIILCSGAYNKKEGIFSIKTDLTVL